MDQDVTLYGGRPRPGDFVLYGELGTQSPLPKKVRSPKFLAHVYCGQTAGWIKMVLGMQLGLGLGLIVLDGDPAPLPIGAYPPNFRPTSVAAKWLHESTCHLVWS